MHLIKKLSLVNKGIMVMCVFFQYSAGQTPASG